MTDDLPTVADQEHAFRNRMATYDAAMEAWRAGGKLGPPPPRPVAPHVRGWNPSDETQRS